MQSATYIDPHQITTGDQYEDLKIGLTLVLIGNAGRREYSTDVAEAVRFDNAYDHAESSCETPNADDGVWYERS